MSESHDVCELFAGFLDGRLLDIATEPDSFISIPDYVRWVLSSPQHLAHLWNAVSVRDCVAASWQDACRHASVSPIDAYWLTRRRALLASWGVESDQTS
jgi:hypothetical protein